MSRRDSDRICPNCGFPLPLDKLSGKCPQCRYDFATRTAPQPRAYLTVFGYGMCGVVAGAFIGAAWALILPPKLHRPMMILLPLTGAVVVALAAAWLGKHLDREHRRAYELLLLSADAGAMAAVAAALFGVYAGAALFGIGLVVAVVVRAVLARLPQLDAPPESETD